MVQVLHLKKIKKGLAKYAALFLAASISLSVSAVEYAANFKGTDINEFINIVDICVFKVCKLTQPLTQM